MIVTVVGARPQFVKAAVVSRALHDLGVAECVVHSGQHYDETMSDIFWKELELPGVAVNLQVGSGRHGAQTGTIMERLEAFLMDQCARVRGLLVYGDTNSTLAAALVGAKLDLPIFHVEAGLRSFNRRMPEEVNRIVTDHISSLLFCPSEGAREQLEKEGITNGVRVVGDVMLDALRTFLPLAKGRSLDHLEWGRTGLRRVLLTVHRPSNTDAPERLASLLSVLSDLPVDVLWPVHPRVQSQLGKLRIPTNVRGCAPLSYLEMLAALDLADLVVTDSGGLQKEAYWMLRPCVTLRAETEWVETVHAGCNKLVGESDGALRDAILGPTATEYPPLYGDGHAAQRIAQQVSQFR